MSDNPLGISTGQGKGLAQVFGDTYSDYYKQKADEGAKKKAEIEKAMAQSSAGVWDRDLGLFKPMRDDIRKYVRDNARAIIDGDFDATIGWQQKKNDMTQFVESSKAAKDFFDKTLKMYNNNPEKYSDLSLSDLMDYGRTAGRFDSNVSLEGKFDPAESIDAMMSDLSKVEYVDTGAEAKAYGADGREFLVETSAQRKSAAKEILDARIARDMKFFPRQAQKHWNDPNNYNTQLKMLEDSLGSKRKSTQLYVDKSDGTTSPSKEKLEIIDEFKTKTSIPFATQDADGNTITSMQPNQDITQNFRMTFNSGRFEGVPSSNAIPIGGAYAYNQYEPDPKNPNQQKLFSKNYAAVAGEEFDIKRVRNSLPEGKWDVESISVMNAFSPDSKGVKTGDVIAGYPIPDSYLGQLKPGQTAEKRAYATLTNKDGQKIFVPVKDVESSLKETYKGEWLEKKKQIIDKIRNAGGDYLTALKDFSDIKTSKGPAYK